MEMLGSGIRMYTARTITDEISFKKISEAPGMGVVRSL
jgi:hypothetical protein